MNTIQTLLQGRNTEFDAAKRIKLVRHATTHQVLGQYYEGTVSDLYQNKQLFLKYQRHQRRNNFATTEYVVSFIGEEGPNSLFVGVFKNNGETDEFEPEPRDCYFDFEEVSGFEDLKENVIVKWKNPRGWHQWYDNEMEVIVSPVQSISTEERELLYKPFKLNINDRNRHTQESVKTIEALHQKMQVAIVDILSKEGYTDIICEAEHVDIRAKMKGIPHFFEVKTYDSAKSCIREAIGQILEYNHYPKNNRAAEMYIIGPVKALPDDIEYLHFLRSNYKMRLFYRQYFAKDNLLLTKV